MVLTGSEARIFQVHVTRRCNLRCIHCYSSSGPEERDALPFPLLAQAIKDAAALGYNIVSFSGGEPLIRPDVTRLAAEAHSHGMAVVCVTNGLLLNARRIAELKGSVDMLAVSLDGSPQRHNYMRAAPRAFEQMTAKLPLLREAQLPFGIVFTLTRDNLPELGWAAQFAFEAGARLFQIHPLELTGRAADHLAGNEPTEDLPVRCWLAVQRLRQLYSGEMTIQVDLTNTSFPPLSAEECISYAGECLAGGRKLAHFLSPLVLEPDGSVVPLRFGFPSRFALGSLKAQNLETLAQAWIGKHALPLAHLYRRALANAHQLSWPVINLFDLLTAQDSTLLNSTMEICEQFHSTSTALVVLTAP